jgi:hypothetical protein
MLGCRFTAALIVTNNSTLERNGFDTHVVDGLDMECMVNASHVLCPGGNVHSNSPSSLENNMRIQPSSLVTLLIITSLLGCGSSDQLQRVVVSGAVKFKGQQVEKGQIRFIPIEGTKGPVTIDAIDHGQYTTKNTGGVPVGTHRVEILGYDAKLYASAGTGPGAPPVPQLLPKKYNLQSVLTEKLEPTLSSQTVDFDLNP